MVSPSRPRRRLKQGSCYIVTIVQFQRLRLQASGCLTADCKVFRRIAASRVLIRTGPGRTPLNWDRILNCYSPALRRRRTGNPAFIPAHQGNDSCDARTRYPSPYPLPQGERGIIVERHGLTLAPGGRGRGPTQRVGRVRGEHQRINSYARRHYAGAAALGTRSRASRGPGTTSSDVALGIRTTDYGSTSIARVVRVTLRALGRAPQLTVAVTV